MARTEVRDAFAGGGEMGERMRACDWAATPLGALETWPQSLKTAVSIMLNSRYPMFVWWGPQLINLYNDAYIHVLGARHPAALGRPARDIWPDIWHILGPQAEIVLRERRATWNDEVLLVMERNNFTEETYFTWSYSPVADDDGTVRGVFCACTEETPKVLGRRRLKTLRDLSARALAESQSVEQACHAAAATIAENPQDLPFALVYLLDADGVHATLRAAVGLDAGTAAAPERIALSTASDNRSFGRAVVVPLARSGGGAEDSPAGVLVAGLSPRLVFDDEYRGFVELVGGHIATAIANARAYEEARQRAESLAEIDRAKTAFFSNVSHEFRTPLTLMLGPLEDALQHPAKSLQGERLDMTYRSALRLLKLVNALLDFSRIEAGRVQASFASTDLAQLTRDLASVFRSAIEHAGLQFVVDCEPLPEPVYVDHEMWEKVVLNLLSNALKFTFTGAIEVRLRAEGGSAVLSVRDTGTGIAPDEVPRLFERFHRIAGARARTHEGSGIGLALVQELVRMHGGAIDADSVVDRGTTFTVRLPFGSHHLRADQLGARRTSTPAATRAAAYVAEALRWMPGEEHELAQPHGTPDGDRAAHILLADDNADMREYVAALLRERWSVETVATGRDALAAARRRTPALVITDIMMPDLDGFGLVRELRHDPDTRSVPVIMLSARAGEESRIEGLEAGADDYLIKPFSARELVARVATHLEIGRLRRVAELEKEHLVSVFTQAPTPICIFRGPDHVIELANPYACRIWGRRLEEVLNRPLFEALPELRGQALPADLDGVVRTGVPCLGKEMPVRFGNRGDGALDERFFNFLFAPLRGVTGDVEGVIGIATDVTDEVRARLDMGRLRADAEAANRAKDEFLAMLGHELRNPLAPIVTALDLLRLRGADAHELDILDRQVGHLGRLVDDLLDVSRIARGAIELRLGIVELGAVVTRALELAGPLIEERRQEMVVQVPTHGLGVRVDEDRMAQAISNLLTNAAKYSDPGSRIVVAAEHDGARVRCRVTDQGLGIAPEMIDRIFEKFIQQPQTLDRATGGLGLGLTIVRSIVELHGGTVQGRSAGVGHGSEFTIELPAVALDTVREDAASPAARRRERAPRSRENAKRILIVDDNQDAVETLQEALRDLGYTVAVAHDGPSALAQALAFRPNIALVDIGLPVMDGHALAERMRALRPEGGIHLVAVTGYGQDTDRQRSADAGFERHLVKPVDLAQLEQVVEDLN